MVAMCASCESTSCDFAHWVSAVFCPIRHADRPYNNNRLGQQFSWLDSCCFSITGYDSIALLYHEMLILPQNTALDDDYSRDRESLSTPIDITYIQYLNLESRETVATCEKLGPMFYDPEFVVELRTLLLLFLRKCCSQKC